MRHKLFLILSIFLLTGCLADNQVSVSSNEDLSMQGLSLEINRDIYPGTIVEVKLKLNYVTAQDVIATIQSIDGTAVSTPGKDYKAINKTLTIPSGQSSASFALETLQTPSLFYDFPRTLQLQISSSSGANIASRTLNVEIKDFEKGPFLPPVIRFASGNNHNCVVLYGGRTKCWGSQNYAQTGSYNSGSFISPVNVVIDSNPSKISSMYNQTCALYSSGKLICWGSNFSGSYEGPTEYLSAGSGAIDVAVGRTLICVAYSTGTVGCFGDNTYSQLGAGTPGVNYPTTTPGMIPSITNAEKVYAGAYFACAKLADSSIVCWGSNWNGELGSGVVNANYIVPVVPTGLGSGTLVMDVKMGHNHACAILFAGTVKCWGANDQGQLGRGTTTPYEMTPDNIDTTEFGTTLPVEIAVNGSHSCARADNGSVYCWGSGQEGQLGDGTTMNSESPRYVPFLPGPAKMISAGYSHTCMVTDGDTVEEYKTYCWGKASSGEISRATFGSASIPTYVSLLGNHDIQKVQIEARVDSVYSNGCASNGGSLICWGDNTYHQLGVGNTQSEYNYLQNVIVPYSVIDFSLGLNHGCALLAVGTIYCWGRNNHNQIADGSASATVDPAVSPSSLSNDFVSIKSGDNHSCALNSTGQVYCWGDHTYGQSGTCSASNVPQLISGLPAIEALELKSNTSCAITTTGLVYCWGSNGNGQFGNGQINTPCQATPTLSVNGETVDKLALGQSHGCALMTTGAVKCWGNDFLGQLGNGSASNSLQLTPTAISSLQDQVEDIQSGLSHTCVLTKTSGVKCWGSNSAGQVGNYYNLSATTTRMANEPVNVFGLEYGILKLNVSSNVSCGISVNSIVKCWGYNRGGIIDYSTYYVPYAEQIFDQFQ